jgi:hypothetical protein
VREEARARHEAELLAAESRKLQWQAMLLSKMSEVGWGKPRVRWGCVRGHVGGVQDVVHVCRLLSLSLSLMCIGARVLTCRCNSRTTNSRGRS